ncbi:MAG: MBL fold metallo-hydrolase [Actinobacteria bacterium]|nr:MBL fold metallo-hydrolase [Actinomycetota bacterium]
MREVKIWVLSDNTAAPPVFLAEHGLSLLLEVEGRRYLLDCGQGEVATINAARMGLDLRGVEAIVLSHGHYDHTAGLPRMLQATGPCRVICHPSAFHAKYYQLGDVRRYIGMPWRRDFLAASGASFEENEGVAELAEGVWVTGAIPRRTDFEPGDPNLKREVDGVLEVDPFLDDQAMVVDTGEGLVVVLGCAHAGAMNTCLYARELTGVERILAVVGGSHLAFLGREQLLRTIDELRKMDPARLAFSHCTGQTAARELAAAFGERFVFNQTGTCLVINESLLA